MVTLAQIESWLAQVADPEIPVVSIRELGILRDVQLHSGEAEIVITPTYSGCPAIEQIEQDIHALLAQHGVPCRVRRQLAPAWTTDWLSESTRDKLRRYGIAPPHTATRQHDSVVHFMPRDPTAAQEPVQCPQCGSGNTVPTAHFASTTCKALYKCLDCQEPFDYFKPY